MKITSSSLKTRFKAFKRHHPHLKKGWNDFSSSLKTNLHSLIHYLKSTKNPHLLIGSIILLTLLIPLVILISKKPPSIAAWWDNSWRYRQSVAITNSGSDQTDYQIAITLDTATLITAGKMQSSCDDIRLTDSNGTLLPHWIDEGTECNTATTKIWTKVPSITTSGETLYLYYGNDYVGNVENGTNVFEFFDDFTGSSFQSGWNQDSGSWSVGTFDNKSTASIEPAAGYNYLRYGNYNTSSSFIIESAIHTTQSGDTSAHPGILFHANNGHNDQFYFRPHSYNLSNNIQYAYWSGSLTAPEAFTGVYNWNDWMNITIKVNGNSAQIFQDGTSKGTRTGLQYDGTYTNVGLASHSGGTNYWAYIAVRQYASTEPVAGTPSSEEAGSLGAYWKLDEGYGSTAHDSSPNSNDTSTWTDATWIDESLCVFGSCLRFDGVNDHMSVTDSVSLSPKSKITVSAWIKPRQCTIDTESAHVIYKSGTLGIACTDSGSQAQFNGWITDASDRKYVYGTSLKADHNRWSYITLTYDGSTVKIYVNGQLSGSTNYTGDIDDSANTLNIGAANTTGYRLDGDIDDVKIYNYARSTEEILTDYNLGMSAMFGRKNEVFMSDGLIGYWKLDESSGNAYDSSGNGLTLTNVNSTSYTSGKYGNGADYERGSSQYHYIADNEELSITGDLTLSAWIKPESNTASTMYNIAGKWDTWTDASYLLTQYGDELRFYVDTASDYVTTTATNLSTSTWYYVAATYNSSSQTATIFVNGEIQTTTTTGTIPSSIGDDSGRFHIGAQNSASSASGLYDGIIDNVMLHKTTLSPNQVIELYNWAPGPIGYWKLDDKTTGSTVNDYSSYGNNLTNYLDKTHGIDYGYKTTNLTFYANQWGGASNTGELYITGSTLTDKDDGSRTVSPLNSGIAMVENLSTAIDGYIMWSSESVHTRFSSNAPHASNADHFITVFYDGINWKYDNNSSSYTFTPVSTDLLVADITFGTSSGVDSITPVQTSTTNIEQTSWGNGQFSSSLDLSDSFLSASDPSDLDFTATDNFTLETWAKTSGGSSNMYLIDKKDATNGGYKLYQDSSGNYCFDIDDDSTWSPDDSVCTSGIDYGDDEWHHITAIKNGTSSISLYIDGVYANSDSSIATTGTLVNTGDFRVGVSWIGSLDDIKIYNYTRNSKQITEDLNAGHPIGGSPISSMVGHWKFDEGYGTSARNSNGYPAIGGSGAATGGTITESDGWKIHTFTTSNDGAGVFNVSSAIENAKVLVVAGGGGGGQEGGGGGGGGEVESYTGVSISAGAKDITVGSGGAGSTGSRGTNGGNSTALGYTAVGGGGGGDYKGGSGVETGKDGGSGGGGASSHTITTLGGSGTASGGDGKGNGGWKASPFPAGGGGGAGHDGYPGNLVDNGGNGGAGKSSDISGSSLYYGGGGGGAVYGYGDPGSGGSGGGGDGGETGQAAEDGTDNLGGGGGGGGNNLGGGDGGNGTVIISYSESSTSTIDGASWTNDGKFGKALHYDGVDDYVSVPDSNALNFGSDSFTVSYWINFDTGTSQQRWSLAKGSPYLSTGAGWAIANWTTGDPVTPVLYVSDGTGGENHTVNFESMYRGTWHHLTFVIDRDNNLAKTYFDGNFANQLDISSLGSFDNTDNLIMGAYNGPSNYSDLKIDEVKIYSAALTPEQVLIDMNQGKSAVMGNLSTASDGSTPDNSSAREYCIPGDTSTCNSPIGEWKFDENTGTSAYDTSENNYTGSITSATWTQGKVGQALNFDGSNDWVDLGNLGNPGAGTISFWFKKSNINAGAQYLLDGRSTATWWLLQDYVSGACTDASGNVCFKGLVEIPSSLLSNDTWEHVTLTSNSTESKIYLNGKLIDTGTGLALDLRSIRIGTRYTNSAYFNGQIDDVRIYDYIRTPAQIVWDYNRGKPVAWWKLDEGTSTTANDSSTFDNDGVISGSAYAWKTTSQCISNQCLYLDSSDTVTVADSNNSLDLSENLSFSFWWKPESQHSGYGYRILKKFSSTSTANLAVYFFGNNSGTQPENEGKIRVYATRGSVWGSISGTYDVADSELNNWMHVAFSYNSSTGGQLYINGEPQGSPTGSGSLSTNNDSFIINDGIPNFSIDDVRVYNYAITSQQIKALYNLGNVVNFSL